MPKVLASLGLNRRELAFLKDQPFPELAALYYKPYYSAFQDEYRPFDAGLDYLDGISTTELFRRDGASPGALKLIGGSGSALQSVWHAAIRHLHGSPLLALHVFRLTGGNQTLPDTFAKHLGDRVKLKTPVTKIEHAATGVKVTAGVGSAATTYEGDYLVCAMSAFMLRNVPVEPAFPAGKVFALQNVPYYHDTRVIFQTRSRFWEKDNVTSTMEFNVPELNHVWRTGEDVQTTRGLLIGTSTGPQTGDGAAAAYRRMYPGEIGGHREVAGGGLGYESVGVGVRDDRVSGWHVEEVLAGAHRAARARALRRRLRGHSQSRPGSRDAIRQSSGGGHRQGLRCLGARSCVSYSLTGPEHILRATSFDSEAIMDPRYERSAPGH